MNKIDIIKIIERGLKVQYGTLTCTSSHATVPEWDSLGHLGVLLELDKIFTGKIASIEDMATANSVEKIIQILEEHSLLNTEPV